MKKIITLVTAAALATGLTASAFAHPTDMRAANHPHFNNFHGRYSHGSFHGYRHGYYHHGYYGGPYYGGYDDGDDAWAGVLPGVVFGTILGAAINR